MKWWYNNLGYCTHFISSILLQEVILKTLLLMALIGGLIGWLTNVIAIKLLFRPIVPIKIPLTPFYIQGLMPKRRSEIAKSIGETVQNELLSIEEIMDELIEAMDKTEIIEAIKKYVLKLVEEKMPSMVPSMFRGMIVKYVGELIDEQGEQIINELSEKVIHHASENVNISEMVENKINAFPMEELERLVLDIAKKELKHIEVLGGIIGLVIGIIQWGLVMLLL